MRRAHKQRASRLRRQKAIPPFLGENYESHWGCFSFAGKTVLDIGADYGSTAAFFLQKGAKSVIAVEPDPALFAKLVSNFSGRTDVVPVNLEISEPRHFEELILRFKPDILKADCEGCEIQLTKVRPALLKKVREYLVETHEHIGLGTRREIERLFEMLHYSHETCQVLPGVEVVHAKSAWDTIVLPEDELVRLKNALSFRTEYFKTQTNELQKAKDQLRLLEKKLSSDPLSALLHLYTTRPDLQRAYPEVRNGDYRHLLEWADNIIRNHLEKHASLSRFTTWYRDNPILDSLRTDARKLTAELDKLKQHTETLENELSSKSEELNERTAELDKLRSRVDTISLERSALNATLSTLTKTLWSTQGELEDIKRSFGYKLMRFYGSRIDRLLPDGTRRGEFKRVVVFSARIVASEGVKSLFRQMLEKLKRREFRIARTGPILEAAEPQRTTLSSVEPEERRLADTHDILVHCEFPDLSGAGPAKVSDWFIVTGWAVARNGLREVRVYLDENLLGTANYGISRPDIGAAFPDFQDSQFAGFRKIMNLENEMKKGLHTIRIVAEDKRHSSAAIGGLIEREFQENIRITDMQEENEAEEEPVAGRTSVIITAKSPSAEFVQALERLRNQEGIENPEIIIIGPAEKDMMSLAGTYGDRVLDIGSANIDDMSAIGGAVQSAAGDYICFLAEDAIPANKHFLRDLAKALQTDTKVAVATTRRIPRTDADLMTCVTATDYRKENLPISNRTVSLRELAGLKGEERSSLYGALGVCACFRRDAFRTFDPTLRSAELASRLMKDGLKCVQVSSTAIIHSHNMSPFEYLRHEYIETKMLPDLFAYHQRQLDFGNFESLDHLLDCAADLHDALCSAINLLEATGFYDCDICKTFQAIEMTLSNNHESPDIGRSANYDLSKALSDMSELVRHVRSKRPKANPMRHAFAHSIPVLENFLSRTHNNLADMESELVEALYQLAGRVIGTCMARWFRSRPDHSPDERETQLDEFLSRGLQ